MATGEIRMPSTRRQKSEGRGQKAIRNIRYAAFRELVNWLVISAALV